MSVKIVKETNDKVNIRSWKEDFNNMEKEKRISSLNWSQKEERGDH